MIVRIKKELVSKVIISNGGKILLLKRAAESVSEDSPWTWDLPGGHLDAGETFQQAAIREVFEETKLILTEVSYVGHDKNNDKMTYFYITNQWSGDIRLSHEHQDHKWVSVASVDGYKYDVGSMYYEMIMKAVKTR